MLSLSDAQAAPFRRSIAVGATESFVQALGSDLYPDEATSWLFGVSDENTDVGPLVYNAWIGLFKAGHVTQDTLVEALLEGALPQLFEREVRAHPQSVYAQSLVRDDRFAEIEWDERSQNEIAGAIPLYWNENLFFALGVRADKGDDAEGGDAERERRAAAPLAFGGERGPRITADEQFEFEVAVRDEKYEVAMTLLEATPELFRHMELTGDTLRWTLVDHPPFRTAYPAFHAKLAALQAQRRATMAELGISD